ncbi:unnamed protein product [Triticum turgidum subsp. durum]|uniref:Uncharacterized protein n=1 Tax=Triticum turgidum subsp. durum TaxID=4567 RepID=A0A9R0RV41_TRITD|nr:unnamed protein product [Triticum turgidum subsp. durum]
MNKIAMLRPILEKYWPSLYCGDTSTCFGGRGPFWAHEWATHGTCGYPEIQDEYDYFSTALYLYSKYNVTKALRKAQIYPRNGRKYAVAHIVDAIDHAFGRLPHLVCKNGSVQELRLCFHKDYQSRRSHCPRYVTLPSYKQSASGNATEGRLRNPAENQPRVHGQSYL